MVNNISIGTEDPTLHELGTQLEGLKPTYLSWHIVPVVFTSPKLVNEYSHLLAQRLNFSFPVPRNYNEDEVAKYLNTLLAIRISYVRQQKFLTSKKYDRFQYSEAVTVPAVFNVLLNQVGRVVDDELGIELIPAIADELPLLDSKRFNQMSIELRDLRAIGETYATVLPRDRKGDSLFMSLSMEDEHVVGRDPKVHPTQVFLGAFYEAVVTDDVVKPLLSFASVDSLRRVVGNVIK